MVILFATGVLLVQHGRAATLPASSALASQTNKLYWEKVHQQSLRRKQDETRQRSEIRAEIQRALPQYVQAARSTHLVSAKDVLSFQPRRVGLSPEGRRNLLLFILATLLVIAGVARRFQRQIAALMHAHFNPWMASSCAAQVRAMRQMPIQEIRWALDVSGCHDVLGSRDHEARTLTSRTEIQINSGHTATPSAQLPEQAATTTTVSVPPNDRTEPVVLSPEFFAQALFAYMPKHLAILREMLQDITKASEEMQEEMLMNLFLSVHSLKCKADWAELQVISQMTFALEALVKKISESPKHITASALRTVANAVDLLEDLCVPGLKADLATASPIRILAVDDDALSRRALTSALQMAFLKPETADNGETALALTSEKAFEVIFLDVQMPDMDGFSVCSRIRGTGPNRQTPVVFVTSQADFKTRAQSVLSGGNELIAKPFLMIEITVKALTFALRGRLQRLKSDQSQSTSDSQDAATTSVSTDTQSDLLHTEAASGPDIINESQGDAIADESAQKQAA